MWAYWLHILLIRGHPLVVLIVWAYFLCQVDGQECLRTSSSYLCFSRLKLYSCCITKFEQVRFEPLCVRSTRSPRFVIDLNFQNFFVHFGLTDSPISVIPRSLSRSRFPPKPSRTHRVEKLGPTDLAYAIAQVRLGLTENYLSVWPIFELSETLVVSVPPNCDSVLPSSLV